MKRLILLLLLLPALAQAGTWKCNFDFPGAWPGQDYWIQPQVGTITNHGITAKFGRTFAYAFDCDNDTDPDSVLHVCGCGQGGNDSVREPIEKWSGDFANEPSAGGAMRQYPNTECYPGESFEECNSNLRRIRFDPPIRHFGVWISADDSYQSWMCPGWLCAWAGGPPAASYCDNPQGGAVNAIVPPRIDLVDTLVTVVNGITSYEYNHVFATTAIPSIDGSVGCSGDPHGHYCAWQWVEVNSDIPVSFVFIKIDGGYPNFFDNAEAWVTPPCPDPPCEFERAVPLPTPALRRSWGSIKTIYR